MYYNIRIKCDDSELSLESDNINVTQREMDIYFAYFFDVSEDYNKRIHSFLPERKAAPKITKEVRMSDTLEEHSNEINIDKESFKEEKPIEVVSFKKEVEIPKLDEVQTRGIRTFVVSSDKNFKNESCNDFTEAKTESGSDVFILNNESDLDSVLNPKKEPDIIPTPSMEDIEALAAVSPVDYDVTIPVYSYEEYQNNELSAIFATPSSIETQDNFTTLSSDVTVISPELDKAYKEQSFSEFLSKFNVSDIQDEFMICAYYIKYIVRQDAFMIKFINSKLFSATGRIADTTLVNDLINKKYIKVIDTTDIKLYSITQEGEKYFTNHFQI